MLQQSTPHLQTSLRDVTFCECFARDGLQHEETFVSTEVKLELLDRFTRIGFARIEATSFSHPKHVPQFSDAEAVLAGIRRGPDTRYKATCANLHAVNRALAAKRQGYGPEEISFLISSSRNAVSWTIRVLVRLSNDALPRLDRNTLRAPAAPAAPAPVSRSRSSTAFL